MITSDTQFYIALILAPIIARIIRLIRFKINAQPLTMEETMAAMHSGRTDSGRVREELGVRYIRDMYDGRVKDVEFIPPAPKVSNFTKFIRLFIGGKK